LIVADTNLLVYLYVEGERTEQAEAVVGRDPVWAAPLLWRSEFRNVMVGMLRQGVFGMDAALRVIREAEHWMRGHEYSVASDQVLQLAVASRCSAYDCEFITLAQDLGVPLVTADQQVLAAFPDTAVALAQFARQRSAQ
jgi:predicted nucleic acid-binding protein